MPVSMSSPPLSSTFLTAPPLPIASTTISFSLNVLSIVFPCSRLLAMEGGGCMSFGCLLFSLFARSLLKYKAGFVVATANKENRGDREVTIDSCFAMAHGAKANDRKQETINFLGFFYINCYYLEQQTFLVFINYNHRIEVWKQHFKHKSEPLLDFLNKKRNLGLPRPIFLSNSSVQPLDGWQSDGAQFIYLFLKKKNL